MLGRLRRETDCVARCNPVMWLSRFGGLDCSWSVPSTVSRTNRVGGTPRITSSSQPNTAYSNRLQPLNFGAASLGTRLNAVTTSSGYQGYPYSLQTAETCQKDSCSSAVAVMASRM